MPKNDVDLVISYIENYRKELEKNKQYLELKYINEIFYEYVKKLISKYSINKDFISAIKLCKYIYKNYPDDTDNIKMYINCFENTSPKDLYIINNQELRETRNDAEICRIISEIYLKRGNYKKALISYCFFLKMLNKNKLNFIDLYFIQIYYLEMYNQTNNVDYKRKALVCLKKALEIEPKNKTIMQKAIVIASEIKDYKSLRKYFNKYINLGYDMNLLLISLYGDLCMFEKDIEGWKKYCRLYQKHKSSIYSDNLNKPEWTGKENLSKSTLLIINEEGYGDNFLIWGYIPRLKKNCEKIIYYMEDTLYELFKNNDLDIDIYPLSSTNIKNLKYDYYIPCMSVPIALNVTLENISVNGGYIKADERLVKKYREKYFDNGKFKIGIAFRGRNISSDIYSLRKNIPAEKFSSLDSLNNVQFYCLTKDAADEELKCFKRNGIINLAKEFSSFADTAAAIENMDIVVSGDNCILNLAGAMGKKTLGMFSYYYPPGRWYDLSREDCGYYKSVKPIINDENDNWEISMQKAVKEIQSIMADDKMI
ncbi:MAG: hypothetical protein LUH05_01575 [Candidatus Gastranaerophilales bacterium]|nr:hypothetical protein [Candidatus Gastranaerophilales bacterium]